MNGPTRSPEERADLLRRRIESDFPDCMIVVTWNGQSDQPARVRVVLPDGESAIARSRVPITDNPTLIRFAVQAIDKLRAWREQHQHG